MYDFVAFVAFIVIWFNSTNDNDTYEMTMTMTMKWFY